MKIYFLDKNDNVRIKLFNGLADLEKHWEAGDLDFLKTINGNLAIQSGNFAKDTLASIDTVVEVLRELKKSVNANPQVYVGCDFELEEIPHFKGEEYWFGKINKAIEAMKLTFAEDDLNWIREEALANLECYTAGGSAANSVAKDAVKIAVNSFMDM